jgi:GNAT superfamily N-acetyltransferase
MTLTIRDYAPGDLQALQDLHVALGREATVDRAAAQIDDAADADPLLRVVAVETGIVGYAYTARSDWQAPGLFEAEVFVAPAHRRRGIGTHLAGAVLERSARGGATAVTTYVDGRQPECLRFAERHEFEVIQRFVTMVLTLDQADISRLQSLTEHATAQGVRFFTYADVAHSPRARRKLYELNRTLAPLLPGNDDQFPSFEEYERDILGASWFRPEGQLIAAAGDEWIALMGLGFYDGGRRIRNEFTAVAPPFQQRGIGRALKAWSVEHARRLGAHEIRTGNDVTNEAIIRVNDVTGYVTEPGVIKLRRLLPAREARRAG